MTCNWCQCRLLAHEPTVTVSEKVFHAGCIDVWRAYWKEVIWANRRLIARRPD
jgi:hypothetical protein